MLSSIRSSQLQQNGTYLVVEQHIYKDGTAYDHVYSSVDGNDLLDICQARGINIEEELDRRTAIGEEASNFEIPLSDIDIMRRMTVQEWIWFSTSTIPEIKYFFGIFSKTKLIYRSDPLTVLGFQIFVSYGGLSPLRVLEILA